MDWSKTNKHIHFEDKALVWPLLIWRIELLPIQRVKQGWASHLNDSSSVEKSYSVVSLSPRMMTSSLMSRLSLVSRFPPSLSILGATMSPASSGSCTVTHVVTVIALCSLHLHTVDSLQDLWSLQVAAAPLHWEQLLSFLVNTNFDKYLNTSQYFKVFEFDIQKENFPSLVSQLFSLSLSSLSSPPFPLQISTWNGV